MSNTQTITRVRLLVTSLFVTALLFVTNLLNAQKGPGGVGNTDGTSNLKLWLSAGAGTSTTTNGATVSSWNDLSGWGYHVTQSTTNNQPVYTTNSLNGQPAITFDGVNDYFSRSSYPLFATNTSPLTVFVVFNPTDISTQRFLLHNPQSNCSNNLELGYHTGNGTTANWGVHNGCSNAAVSESAATTSYNIMTFKALASGTSPSNVLMSKNGTALTITNNAGGWASAGNYGTTANTLYVGGRVDQGNCFHAGAIAEIISFNTSLNSAQVRLVENYLNAKYNITIANDKYAQPTATTYIKTVAGIGKESDGSNTTGNSDGLILTNSSFLNDNGDYFVWGYDNAATTTSILDLPIGISSRWARDWFVDKTDVSSNNGNVTVSFDFSDMGIGGTPTGSYKLLYRSLTTGNYSIVTGTSSISGDQVSFTVDASLLADGYYTLGTQANNGNALDFDGVDDYIAVPHSSSLNVSSGGQLTIEAWVNPNNTSSWRNILLKGNYGYGFAITPGNNIYFWDQSGGLGNVPASDGTVTPGSWNHVAVTVQDNGSNLTVTYYINGVNAGTKTSTIAQINDNTDELRIGIQGTGCNCNRFNGKIDELRIWNVVRTPSQISSNMNAELSDQTGIIALYHFNQGTAGGSNSGITNLTDASANANNGTLTNFALTGSTSNWVVGTVGTTTSTNANLSALTISAGTLSPTFAAATTTYTASVSNATTSITVTPTVADATATIQARVNSGSYATVTSGSPSAALSLNIGSNTIDVKVTAQDGTTIKTYTITVTRAASSNADLSALVLSSGTLSPSFAAATTTYTASVSNATTSVTVTPTIADATATITVNSVTVTSGSPSGAIALTEGLNTITVVVTAQDGTTTKTYTITVDRAALNTLNAVGLTSANPAASAYSLRKLSSSYSGNAIQVRRSSDNTLQNFGFTVAGDLDTAALKTFVGSGDGFVATWYDQSGNGRNMLQASTSLQPSIITAGNIVRLNGKPAVYFGNNILSTGNITMFTSGASMVAYAKGNSTTPSSLVTKTGTSSISNFFPGPFDFVNIVGQLYVGKASTNSGNFIDLKNATPRADISSLVSASVYSFVVPTSGTFYTYRNGTQTGSQTVGAYADEGSPLIMGNRLTNDGSGNFWVSEIILFNEALNSTVRQTVENSLAGNFSLSTNADLSSLTISTGTLSPTFATATTTYTASVSNATTSITVTPTKSDANATIQVRVNSGSYATVTSGSPSAALSLNIGSNTIDVLVTAQDGTTTKTYTVTLTRAIAPPGNALHFDGSNDYAESSNIGSLTDVTIETWLSPGANPFNWFLIAGNPSTGTSLYLENNVLKWVGQLGGNFIINSNRILESGKWYHVAAVKSGATVTLYLNGENVGSVTGSSNQSYANSTVLFGKHYIGLNYNGKLDEVRVWNTALTALQLQTNMYNTINPSTSGLIAYYNFDNGTAGGTNTGVTTLTDQTSTGANATLTNFELTGSTSNWVESYAMVVPTATAATSTTGTGFTANWTAPSIGTVTNYLLDVSTSSTFSSFVSGYNSLVVSGTSQAVTGLAPNTSYYYRVRADKTSVTGQGAYSTVITATTIASSNADLSTLALSSGTLSPTFAAATTTYTASVSNATTSITVTPTVADATATVQARVNSGSYATVTSGSPSAALSLNIGSNTIDVKVTAQDGTTIKTYTITVTRLMTPPGNALHFDGVNDYVSTGINLVSSSVFTIEFWLNPSNTSNNRRILSSTSGPTTLAAIMFDNGKVQYWNGGAWLDISPISLPANKWSHVAVTSNGSQVTGFINGVQQTTISSTAAWQSIGIGNPFVMAYGDYYNGYFDEVRIWNTARTPSQIQANMSNTISASSSGLVAYYNFDNGTAGGTNTGLTTLSDQTSNANNGTLNNFALTGSTSNWVESYAMVVPTATAATSITGTGFIANWTAPSIGTVTNYLLDVSTNSTFSSFVSGYNSLVVSGTSQAVTGLASGTSYYYRVRADKTSVTGQGAYSTVITATTLVSSNADLSALALSSGTLSPTFAAATTTYTASVSNATTSITVTPTKSDANATIQVRVNSGSYATVTSGSPSAALSLNIGSNTIDVKVTAQDGTTIKTYTITVTRLSNDATLSSLVLKTGGATLSSVSAPLLARYDATNTSSLTQSAGVVTGWNDLSGNNYNLVQSTTGPTLTTINGIQALDFNSVKRLTNSSVPVSQNVTVLMVIEYNSAIATWGNFMCHGNHDNDWSMRHNSNGDNRVGFHTYNDNDVVLRPLVNGNTYILVGRLKQNGNSTNLVEFWLHNLNGTADSVSATFPTTITTGNKAMFVGSSDLVNEASNGKIGEILYYNSTLNNTDLSSAVNYLKGKWFASSGGGTIIPLSPTFSSGTNSYNASVGITTSSATVTPTINQANATVQVRVNSGTYSALSSGSESSSLALNAGNNTIDVKVTAQDNTTVNTYSINVLRASNNADLSALSISSGTLSPAFAAATTAYSVNVSNSTTSITVTPTLADATASIQVRVNGGSYATVTSGSPSSALSLNAGSNTIDVKVTAQDGTTIKTYTITATRAFLPPGNALHFDGTNDNVTFASSITNLNKANFTIEAWIKTTAVSCGIVNCANSNTSWETGEKVFYLNASGMPTFVGWGNDYINSNVAVNDNKWHHVAVVWSYSGSGTSGTPKMYVDGVDRTASSNYAANNDNLGFFKLGMPNYFGGEAPNYFSGTMDEVRIWNTARTQAEIQANMLSTISGSTSGLVAYYNFDNGIAGGTNTGVTSLVDQTSNANTGTLTNFALTGSTSNWIASTAWNTWTGATSADYATATNWQLGTVPTSADNIVIPTGASNLPVTVSSAQAFYNAQVQASAALTNTSTLSIAGNLFNSGTITSTAGTIAYTGSSAQTVNANTFASNTVQGLTINNTTGVTLAGALTVTGVLTPTAGTLTTGNFLTLASSATGTARVAAGTGSYISGNTTVQRYIPGGKRAFRFLSHPFNSSLALSSLTDNIDITGSGGSPLTTTVTNAPSAFAYDNSIGNSSLASDPGWTPLTASSVFNAKAGYRILIRGSKGQVGSLTGGTYTPDPVTLDWVGVLNQGSQTVTLTNNGANRDFSLLGNPFASPIDLSLTTRGSNINANFYVWNPNLSTNGAYQANSFGASYILASGAAFFTQAAANTNNAITFPESAKVSGTPSASLFRNTSTDEVLTLQVNDNNGNYADKLQFFFNGAPYTANYDMLWDAMKLNNPDVNCYSFSDDSKKLAIDRRPLSNQPILLGLTANLAGNYQFVVNDLPNSSYEFYLKDKFLNTETKLVLNATVAFAVTTDPASQGNARFEIVTKANSALATTFVKVAAAQKANGIEVTWNTANETNINNYIVEESADGINFSYATSIKAKNASSNAYTWFDDVVNNGNNYYRIIAVENNGMMKYSSIVKVKLGAKATELLVYPNPAKAGNNLHLQINNAYKGNYLVKIFNNNGQEINKLNLNVVADNFTTSLQLGLLPAGKYNLLVTMPNGDTSIKNIVVE